MYYKQHFRRVRASFICPGLVPPFGPPGHPSFPSGHSFLGHLIALLLLEIPSLAERYGIFADPLADSLADPLLPGERLEQRFARRPETLKGLTPYEYICKRWTLEPEFRLLTGRREIPSPLLWLSQRLAKNRERIGVHYPSDSSGSRHLAAGIWWALLHADKNEQIVCPTLQKVLLQAKSEWARAV